MFKPKQWPEDYFDGQLTGLIQFDYFNASPSGTTIIHLTNNDLDLV